MNNHILIVEDELFVVLELEFIVSEAGFRTSRHCSTLGAAMEAIASSQPACAILDVRLPDGDVFPAADLLTELKVPIIFHSGHADEQALRARYPHAQVCSKPSSSSQLRDAICRAVKIKNDV